MPNYKVIRRKKTIFEQNDTDLVWLKEECRFSHHMAKRLLYDRKWVRRWRRFFTARKDIDKPGAYMQKYGAVRQGHSTGLEPPAIVETESGETKQATTWTEWQRRLAAARTVEQYQAIKSTAQREKGDAAVDVVRIARHRILAFGDTPRASELQSAAEILRRLYPEEICD